MIQFAKPEDIPQIVAFGYAGYNENDLNSLNCTIDFNKGLATITSAVLNEVVLVKRNDANPASLDGIVSFTHSKAWFSETPILINLLFYIKPEFRSYKLARDLLCSAKEYAIMNRLPIVFDLFAQKDVEKKKKLLRYLGFKDFGSSFVFNPNTAI